MPHDTSSPQSFRVLVIVSRPLDLQDLPNIADQWSLLGGLRRVNAPAHLKILRPPTVEGLRAEILSGYDIVHFDGHGSFGVRCPNCGGLNQPEQKNPVRQPHRHMADLSLLRSTGLHSRDLQDQSQLAGAGGGRLQGDCGLQAL